MQLKYQVALISFVALLIGLYLQLFGINLPLKHIETEQSEIEGFFWPKQKTMVDFELLDQNKLEFSLDRLKNKWSMLFFGYTHCPDICPITMNTLRGVRNKLKVEQEAISENTNYIFVSVDGERDTTDILKSYIEFFGQSFVGLAGNKAQVDSLASQLGVPYTIDDHEPGNSEYFVSHSGSIFLISPDGNLASIFHAPHSVDGITERFKKILRFFDSQS